MSRPSLTTLIRRAMAGETALPPGSSVLVAVSGGPDSMALLDALCRATRTLGVAVVAHGVDHGLRPEAGAELDRAAALAVELGVPFDRTVVHIPPGGNLQERAREARWAALVAAARSRGAAIATGHHAGDRAETVLLRLLRGSGLRGLGVLPARAAAPGAADVSIIRPLLRAERQDVLTHLERHRIPFAADPSNLDGRFSRTRVRTEVLPLLAALDPGIIHHLADLADEACALTGDSTRPSGGSLRWAAGLPRATQAAITALVRSRSPDACVWLPGGLELRAAASASGERGGGERGDRKGERKAPRRRARLPGRNSSG
jgi:tRNA(Ile)-lysidine synthase